MSRDRKFPRQEISFLRVTLDYASPGERNGLECHHRLSGRIQIGSLIPPRYRLSLKGHRDLCSPLRAFVARWRKQLENLAQDFGKRDRRSDTYSREGERDRPARNRYTRAAARREPISRGTYPRFPFRSARD